MQESILKEIQSQPQPVDYNCIAAAATKFLAAIEYTADQVTRVEQATRGQRLCKCWQQERQFRLTASKFEMVIKCRRNHTALVKQLLYTKVYNGGVSALVWGQQHEADAFDAYKTTLGSDFTV